MTRRATLGEFVSTIIQVSSVKSARRQWNKLAVYSSSLRAVWQVTRRRVAFAQRGMAPRAGVIEQIKRIPAGNFPLHSLRLPVLSTRSRARVAQVSRVSRSSTAQRSPGRGIRRVAWAYGSRPQPSLTLPSTIPSSASPLSCSCVGCSLLSRPPVAVYASGPLVHGVHRGAPAAAG